MKRMADSEAGFSHLLIVLFVALAVIVGGTAWNIRRSQVALQKIEDNTKNGLAIQTKDPRAGLIEAGVGEDQGIIISDVPGPAQPTEANNGPKKLDIDLGNGRAGTMVWLHDKTTIQ